MQIFPLLTRQLRWLMLFGLIFSASSTADMYGVFQVGGIDGKDDLSRDEGAAYKLGIGYEFHKQWYVEFGYQQLGDGDPGTLPASLQEIQEFEGEMQADALFVSFLGKAAGRDGELYYRLGLLKTDVKGEAVIPTAETCSLGSGTTFSVVDQSYTYCAYDEAGVAGSIGLGYDYFLGTNTLIRFEAEHVRGDNGLEVSAAYIGLRYNFN